jgi:hypothetical protein
VDDFRVYTKALAQTEIQVLFDLGGKPMDTKWDYEAEDAVVSGGVISNGMPGYSGTGFVDYVNASGDYVEWTVDIASEGDYDLEFRYANGSTDRPLEIQLNGQVVAVSLSFPGTGSWTTWGMTSPLTVSLNAGSNTVRATAIGSSGGNVDLLRVIERDISNHAPVFENTTRAAISSQAISGVLAPFAFDWDGSDPNSPLNFSKVSGSAWLIVAGDGTLSGTPGSGDVGENVFTVRVTDGGGLSTDATLTITVYDVQGTYEAEDAFLGGSCQVVNNQSGYTGTGFVDYVNSSGDYVEWTVNANQAQTVILDFRYALDGGDRPLEIQVNGQVVAASLSFPGSGWSTWVYTATVEASFNAGDNTIRATAIGSSGANVDHLRVLKNNPPVFTADLISKPNATEDAIYTGQSLAGSATDADSGPLIYSKINGPAWLTVASDGTLGGTPADGDIGGNAFTVHVDDDQGFFDEAMLNITVLNLYTGEFGLSDFAGFALNWLESGCGLCGGADLTGDGNVGIEDLEVLAGNWLSGN